MAWVSSLVVGAVVMVALLTLLYRFVPNRTFRFKDVLPGAVLAGVLIELLSLGFPLYQRLSHSFNTYGAQFGLFFLLAAWLYLLSQVLLFGAVYQPVPPRRAHEEGPHREPCRRLQARAPSDRGDQEGEGTCKDFCRLT